MLKSYFLLCVETLYFIYLHSPWSFYWTLLYSQLPILWQPIKSMWVGRIFGLSFRKTKGSISKVKLVWFYQGFFCELWEHLGCLYTNVCRNGSSGAWGCQLGLFSSSQSGLDMLLQQEISKVLLGCRVGLRKSNPNQKTKKMDAKQLKQDCFTISL